MKARRLGSRRGSLAKSRKDLGLSFEMNGSCGEIRRGSGGMDDRGVQPQSGIGRMHPVEHAADDAVAALPVE